MRRTLTACACLAWVGSGRARGVAASVAGAAPATPPAPPLARAATVSSARALVSTYCVTCHNEHRRPRACSLDKADADQVANSADTWEKVVVQLRSRAMPPVGHAAARQRHLRRRRPTWLETELDRAALARPNPGRPADLHRLNRTEYANAVRDLLGVEIDAAVDAAARRAGPRFRHQRRRARRSSRRCSIAT